MCRNNLFANIFPFIATTIDFATILRFPILCDVYTKTKIEGDHMFQIILVLHTQVHL